jgi:hypothetical protein
MPSEMMKLGMMLEKVLQIDSMVKRKEKWTSQNIANTAPSSLIPSNLNKKKKKIIIKYYLFG